MKTTVIYHSADFDGLLCREIARKFLPPDTEFIGWNFGDQALLIPLDGRIYVMDLPVDQIFGLKFTADDALAPNFIERLVWIDHHKTSIETHPSAIPGYRIDGVAACRLAWQWFTFGVDSATKLPLPSKQDFVERKVDEPIAVRLAGEYDVWDHRGDGDLEFQYGMRLVDQGSDFFEALLQMDSVGEKAVIDTIEHGKILMRYDKRMNAMWLAESWHIIEWEGLKFLAQNSVQRGSGILDSKDKPETGHDALMLYGFRGKLWTVSMYHSAVYRKNELDLSIIAKKHGGGGHKGACGFTCQKLPFMT